MAPCTNNSIMSGILLGSGTGDSTSGNRLAFKQRTNTNWDSAIIAGNVIRYDVPTGQFVKSVADPNFTDTMNFSNAEVVGIVESISNTSGVTYATVVIQGLMNYPNLTTSASSGGDGGTDIYFLSSTIPGGITFEIADGSGFIVKPVLQTCPTSDGNYNSVVINYLGYESSSSVSSFAMNAHMPSVGTIQTVDANSQVPDGWVDSSTTQILPIDEYPDAYETYGTQYGSYEELSVNGSYSFVSALLNQGIRPVDSTTGNGVGPYANVISVDTTNNKIVLDHNYSTEQLWNSNYTTYELQDSVLGLSRVVVTSGQITHFKTPKISTNIETFAGTPNQVLSFTTKTLLRVKPDSVVAYIPDSTQFNNVTIANTLSTPNVQDVDAKLVSYESRIKRLEQILGIS